MKFSNESKTLFIPLYGKAMMSKLKVLINDPKAEDIIKKCDYNFSKLKQSKWLSMYMALRAYIIDELVNQYLIDNKNATVIHLGCGLDSRVLRVNSNYDMWYDIDFDSVIDFRKQFYEENKKYKMIGSSVTNIEWIDNINKSDNTLIVMEGLVMYLSINEIELILEAINNKLDNVTLLFDSYTNKAVKASIYKNPVNKMNAIIKFGMDNPDDLIKLNKNLVFIKEYLIRYKENGLKGITKFIFNNLYCGKISESLYKIYQFKLNNK